MEYDEYIDDVMDSIGMDDSDYETSEDEWRPDRNDEIDDSDDDSILITPPRKKKRRRRQENEDKQLPESRESESDEDDLPLSIIRDRIIERRESMERNLDEEILSQMVDEPYWAECRYEASDTTFKGTVEIVPAEPKSPHQYFSELVTDEMLEKVGEFSNMYALAKGGRELKTSEKEIKIFIGLYLRMGLMKAHRVRAYWAAATRYSPVADEMSRNRFELLVRHIHLCDNNDPAFTDEAKEEDRVWKLRPWLDGLSANLKKITPEQNQCVDEIMVAFKGHHGLKQFMRNKPHRWGFKMWARAASDGILHSFDVYQGGKSKTGEKSTVGGMTGKVVLDMTKDLEDNKNFIVFADNLFSSLALVKALKERGIFYAGTVRDNRLKGCQFKKEKDLKKEGRGSRHTLVETSSNCVAVRWFDNRKVDLISSFVGVEPVKMVNRYDRKNKVVIQVECPAVVSAYNKNMGGVDLLDSLTALYKAHIKSRHWYLYIFFHSLNMAVVTSWLRYRKHGKAQNIQKIMKLSDFQEELATSLIKLQRAPGRPSNSLVVIPRPCASRQPHPVPDDVRLDGVDHWPLYEDRQRCKSKTCTYRSNTQCQKCRVHLCHNKDRNCFLMFHTNK